MKFNLQEFIKNFSIERFYENDFNKKDKYISRSNETWGSFLHKDNVSHTDKANCHLKNIVGYLNMLYQGNNLTLYERKQKIFNKPEPLNFRR